MIWHRDTKKRTNNMDSNEIFEQAKRDGFATIYTDTPDEVVEKVKVYNEEMGVCRVNRKRAENCAMGFILLNPISAIIFCMISMFQSEHIAV